MLCSAAAKWSQFRRHLYVCMSLCLSAKLTNVRIKNPQGPHQLEKNYRTTSAIMFGRTVNKDLSRKACKAKAKDNIPDFWWWCLAY